MLNKTHKPDLERAISLIGQAHAIIDQIVDDTQSDENDTLDDVATSLSDNIDTIQGAIDKIK